MKRVIGLLRSIWTAPAASPEPPRRVWVDWLLLGALPVIALVEGALRSDLAWPALSVAVTIALVPTLLWRRQMPLQMLVLSAAVMELAALVIGAPTELYTSAYFILLPYSLFRWGTGRAATIGLAIILASLARTLFRSGDVGETIGGLTVALAAVSLGAAFRFRASARLREIEQVKLLERGSLARDLHDTVAHHVSAIAIRAQAGLATAATDPDAATDALRVIEAEASRTLAEMRTLVRALRRDGAAEMMPSPRVADLEQLARAEEGGPTVDVTLSGDTESLSPSVAAAIYRLAQESITNARRHARHATRVDVRVDADQHRVRLSVSDDGDGSPGAAPGYGITGMMERAALLGGTCSAGRAAGRGWIVTAELPRSGSPA